MKIITLVENTAISSKYKSKHGLCFYIETSKHKILFDLGSNGLFLENAKKMGVKISEVDTVIISHGHKDHGGALRLFLNSNKTAKVYIRETAFLPYYAKIMGIAFYIGLDKSLKENEQIVLTNEQYVIDEELQLFSNVSEKKYFSLSNNALYVKKENYFERDTFQHEQNLIISEHDKNALVSGCAHNGIVNIIDKAKQVNGSEITHAISGFHLYNPVSYKCESKDLVLQIADYLLSQNTEYYTCHCTGKKAFNILHNVMGKQIKYLSTGSFITI